MRTLDFVGLRKLFVFSKWPPNILTDNSWLTNYTIYYCFQYLPLVQYIADTRVTVYMLLLLLHSKKGFQTTNLWVTLFSSQTRVHRASFFWFRKTSQGVSIMAVMKKKRQFVLTEWQPSEVMKRDIRVITDYDSVIISKMIKSRLTYIVHLACDSHLVVGRV